MLVLERRHGGLSKGVGGTQPYGSGPLNSTGRHSRLLNLAQQQGHFLRVDYCKERLVY